MCDTRTHHNGVLPAQVGTTSDFSEVYLEIASTMGALFGFDLCLGVPASALGIDRPLSRPRALAAEAFGKSVEAVRLDGWKRELEEAMATGEVEIGSDNCLPLKQLSRKI